MYPKKLHLIAFWNRVKEILKLIESHSHMNFVKPSEANVNIYLNIFLDKQMQKVDLSDDHRLGEYNSFSTFEKAHYDRIILLFILRNCIEKEK